LNDNETGRILDFTRQVSHFSFGDRKDIKEIDRSWTWFLGKDNCIKYIQFITRKKEFT